MPASAAKHTLFWLVVHGSYGPGGPDHDRLAQLDGTWHAGSFSGAAGAHFGDLVVKRYQDEPVPGWALQIAPKPEKPGSATEEQGNTSHQLFDAWAGIDELFDDDVVRMDTTFHFDKRQPGEGDVCRANTYGSIAMVPDGRYDAPHPHADLVTLWSEVVAGAKSYEPSTFETLIGSLDPDRYGEVFSSLAAADGFVSRLDRVLTDQTPPQAATGAIVDFTPQPHNAVDDLALIGLARQVLETKSEVIGRVTGTTWDTNADIVAALDYRIAAPESDPELGDVHYDLTELFADACVFAQPAPWTTCLAQACYSLAASYDLMYWLTQDWSNAGGDLEPRDLEHRDLEPRDLEALYTFWKAGGSVVVDIHGVAHVSASHTR